MKTKHLLIVLLSLSLTAKGQQTTADLITDRPDQTESSIVVPHKSLQVETGILLENQNDIKSYAYNTTLLRYGLLENMELRLGLEYLGEDNKITTTKGWSPLYLGFKINVSEEDGWKPEVAFLGAMTTPLTADEYFAPDHTAASMRFSLSHTLSDRLSLGYNVGAEWDGYTTLPSYIYSIVLGFSLTEHVGLYAESYGSIIENNNSEHLLDGGITYLISPNFQLDLSGGIGINDNALDNFISFGATYRFNH